MLVNPYIEGTTPKIFKADNSLLASQAAYESISKYFNNSVHNFKFTLLKVKSDSIDTNSKKLNLKQYGGSAKGKRFETKNFSHFMVKENLKSDNNVTFSINPYTGSINNLEQLVENVMKIQNKFKKAKRAKKSSTSTESGSQSAQSQSDSQSESQSESNSQHGGKKSKYDEDDEDDSPDFFVQKTYYYEPISYWYYSPSIYALDRMYLPTFISPLSFPYVFDFYPTITYGTGYSSVNPSVSVNY